MVTIEKSIFVNRPQQEVFDFLSNPANDPQWRSGAESAEWTSEGPVGVGSTYRSVDRFLWRKLEGTAEITIWDPPNQFGVRTVSGLFPYEGTIKLESKENGTQLTIAAQVEVGGFFKIAGGLVEKLAEKQFVADLNALKLVLEKSRA